MLPDFNHYKPYLIMLLLALAISPSYAQQIVYDLKQDWVYFSKQDGGFLPVGEEDLRTKTINFYLNDAEFDKFYLTIEVQEKAYLFHNSKLLARLPGGISSYRIDSLKKVINDDNPFLTIYGNKLLPGLITEIRTNSIEGRKQEVYQPIRFANTFSNFFYLALTILIVFFVFIKAQFPELASQYLLVHRAFRIRTIDESIYKTQYLGFPNNLFIAFISLTLSFLFLSFMYFFPGQLHFMNINPSTSSFWVLAIDWLQIFLVILVLFILKYFLTIILTKTFALKIDNIHYASSLRFIMLLSLIMMVLTIIEFLAVGIITEPVFWVVFIILLLVMEVILFLKLTFVTSHTLLYIIIYLCATELIPLVFLFKLVTA